MLRYDVCFVMTAFSSLALGRERKVLLSIHAFRELAAASSIRVWEMMYDDRMKYEVWYE